MVRSRISHRSLREFGDGGAVCEWYSRSSKKAEETTKEESLLFVAACGHGPTAFLRAQMKNGRRRLCNERAGTRLSATNGCCVGHGNLYVLCGPHRPATCLLHDSRFINSARPVGIAGTASTTGCNETRRGLSPDAPWPEGAPGRRQDSRWML
ncbi:hypothetical protein BU16DRAFT_8115 [Lophium mytilinum]|uniref:Uncharacterized protein n=1 Tax=Lophium mytilinum TaxID=390894 RepID=A0A6A6RCY8_9PEZI|nr:hypothetical protein BU16DRAFT_8115 [Lophium mytilinum]